MRFFACFGLVCAVAACSSVASNSIKTSGVSAHMNVIADGSGHAIANASLNVGNSLTDYVDLSSGDAFTASAGGQTQTLSRVDALGAISYTATFAGQDGENAAYTIALTRASDTSAPSSTCSLPKAFKITAPAVNATFSRAKDDVVLTWDAVGSDPMTYEISSSGCVTTVVSTSVPVDSGSFTIPKSMFSTTAMNASATCPVTVTLRRSRTGSVDRAYGYGGSISGQQARSVTITSAP